MRHQTFVLLFASLEEVSLQSLGVCHTDPPYSIQDPRDQAAWVENGKIQTRDHFLALPPNSAQKIAEPTSSWVWSTSEEHLKILAKI